MKPQKDKGGSARGNVETHKPPLGLMPRRIYVEQRIAEISNALHRYMVAGKVPPVEWGEELIDHLYFLNAPEPLPSDKAGSGDSDC